jgi:hypothetical protein
VVDAVVNPDLASLLVRADDVRGAEHLDHLGPAHAHPDFALDLADRQAVGRVAFHGGTVLRGRHATSEQHRQ